MTEKLNNFEGEQNVGSDDGGNWLENKSDPNARPVPEFRGGMEKSEEMPDEPHEEPTPPSPEPTPTPKSWPEKHELKTTEETQTWYSKDTSGWKEGQVNAVTGKLEKPTSGERPAVPNNLDREALPKTILDKDYDTMDEMLANISKDIQSRDQK